VAATEAAAIQRRSLMEQFFFWFCETRHCSDLSLTHWAKSS
jgi:hypothetical protein